MFFRKTFKNINKFYPVQKLLNPAPLSIISLNILTDGTPLSKPKPCNLLPSESNCALTFNNSKGAVAMLERKLINMDHSIL